jgi:hypothetical protein
MMGCFRSAASSSKLIKWPGVRLDFLAFWRALALPNCTANIDAVRQALSMKIFEKSLLEIAIWPDQGSRRDVESRKFASKATVF